MADRAELPAAVRAVLDAPLCEDAACPDAYMHGHAHIERVDNYTPDIVTARYKAGVSWAVWMMKMSESSSEGGAPDDVSIGPVTDHPSHP